MNIIRQREQLKDLVKLGALTQRAALEFASAPVFIYQRQEPLRPEEYEWCKQNICSSESHIPTRLPFEVFTIICDWEVESDVKHGVLRVWSRPFATRDVEGKEAKAVQSLTFSCLVDGEDCTIQTHLLGRVNNGAMCFMWKNGKPITVRSEAHRKVIEDGITVPRDIIMRFAFDTVNPASAVVRVDPPQTPSKSVEWHIARRHYLILNRNQASQCRDSKRGPTENEIKRAAHWRRAHLRRLTSSKFKHKQGKLVFVRQAWVGPDEWTGLDGKTYKVIT